MSASISARWQHDTLLVLHPRRQDFDSPLRGGDAGREGVPRAEQDVDQHRALPEAEIRLQRIGTRTETEIR